MITITPEAAAQIRVSTEHSNSGDTPLRIAVEQRSDGSFHYKMGFDDQLQPGDQAIESENINIIIDDASQALANGLMLDFVEFEGAMEFVFMNPNDPNYRPPQE